MRSEMSPGRWLRPALLSAVTIILLLAIWFDVSPLLRGPAPCPPEWQWSYRQDSTVRGSSWVLACAVGLLCLLAVSGLRLARRYPRCTVVVLLCCATVLGWGLQLSLVALEDGRSGADVLVKRTICPAFTSYYTVAISPTAHDVGEFLDHYAALLHELRLIANHASTHPPGAVLFYRGVLSVCEASPALTEWLVGAARRLDVDLRPFSLPGAASWLATALLSPLLLLLLASATCWPVTALACAYGLKPLDAVRVGVLWTLLPGPTLMAPELDQMLALPVTSAAVLLAISYRRTSSRLVTGLVAVAAGIAGGIALFLSYGAVVFLLFGGCVALALAVDRFEDLKRVLLTTVVAVIAAISVNALPMLAGYEPIEATLTALRIHREYYTAPQSYLLWVVFNQWDLAVFLGFPLAGLGLFRLFSVVRGVAWNGWKWPGTPVRRAHVLTVVGLFVLGVSGIVRAEAGRIWIPIMPFLLVAVAARIDVNQRPMAGATSASRVNSSVVGPSVSEAMVLGVLLLACCLVLRLSWNLP